MMVDPARPSDVYALVCATGIGAVTLRSTDYGETFTRVDQQGFSGNPTAGAIDPNACRDPATPPTLYSTAFGAELGLFKSVDGGIHWEQMITGESGQVGLECSDYWPPDFYGVTVLPDDSPNHILVTYHAGGWACPGGGLAESEDGGQTWIEHRGPENFGASHYAVAIDAVTWLVIGEDDFVWRTTTAGRIDGVVSPDAWEVVLSAGHTHGSFQAFLTPTAVYVPVRGGIYRSLDEGATWTNVYDTGNDFVDNVIGTSNHLYSNAFYAPDLKRASGTMDTVWSDYTPLPSGMALGPAPMGATATFDGQRWVIVTANDDAGMWRYVEPDGDR
jgi:photosystem II stability/assembly factor-like uncharacterized protein